MIPSAKSAKGFSSDSHGNNLLEIQEVKLTEMWGLPQRLRPFWSFYLSGLSTLNLHKFINYNSGFSMLAPALMEISAPRFLFW